MRRPRLALTAAAVGLAFAASGCSYINPVQTHNFYQAADGTNANLEEAGQLMVGVRNAIVVVQDDGSAVLIGAVANYTTEEITVELEGLSEGTVVFAGRVAVPAESTVNLGVGEDAQQIQIGQIDVPAGAAMDLSITANGQSTEITLPVTDTTLEYYEEAVQGGSGEGASDGGGSSQDEGTTGA